MEKDQQNKKQNKTLLRNIQQVTEFSTNHNANTNTQQSEQVREIGPKPTFTMERYADYIRRLCSFCFKKPKKSLQLDIDQQQFTKQVQKIRKSKSKKQMFLPIADPGIKTLVLDLDETLVHSSFKKCKNYDFAIDIHITDQTQKVFITKRFGLDIFLFQMSQIYELVVYTAGLKDYTDQVLKLIDPKKRIKHVLYRDQCTILNKNYFIKNLGLLGRNLKQTLLVDDNSMAGIMYPEIFYKIQPFYGSSKDRKLLRLIQFLKEINVQQDFSTLYAKRKLFEKRNSRPCSLLNHKLLQLTKKSAQMVKNASLDSQSTQRNEEMTEVQMKGIDF